MPICFSEVAPVSARAACDGGFDFGFAGGGWKVGFYQLSLGLFFGRQFFAPAFAEHVGGLGALLHQRLEDLHLGRFIERLHGVHLVFLERGLHHPQRAQARFFAGFHGLRHIFLYAVEQGHDFVF